MRQVSISPRTGEVTVGEVPQPHPADGAVLVSVSASVLSIGTETAKVDLRAKSIVAKARSRPDLVSKTIEAAKKDGLRATADLVRSRLRRPEPLGYSCAGVVEEVGRHGKFRLGDRVAAAGEGLASHADFVSIPTNLLAQIPDSVSDEAASYTTIGAIALQGLRQAETRIGETVAIIGLGLVGQLAAQLASASGCVVVGMDLDPVKVRLASQASGLVGAGSPGELGEVVDSVTGGKGVDAVLVTAATASSEPVATAATVLRDRGRVVVVGDVGLDLQRALFYEKELDLRLSRSYGPGRYDVLYEEFGVDYPIGYVRWTEQRNMVAFLELCAKRSVNPEQLTTHRFTIDKAAEAYALLGEKDILTVGVVLEYPDKVISRDLSVRSSSHDSAADEDMVGIAVVGSGNFATRTLIPMITKEPSASLRAVVSERGLSAATAAAQYDGTLAMGSLNEVLDSPDIGAVVIASRHDSHARLTAAALLGGRHVYVEKPLTRVEGELQDVVDAYNSSDRVCFVGFNRRFAPATLAVLDHLKTTTGPRQVLIRVNAGTLDGHWLTDPEIGGGRLVGEGCHFVDLASALVGQSPRSVRALANWEEGATLASVQSFNLLFDYPDGSTATLVYSALGDARFPKERVEVFADGTVCVIDDFASWEMWSGGRRVASKTARMDKGHTAAFSAFLAACRGEPNLLPFEQALQSTVATFTALKALGTRPALDIPQVEVP